MKRRADNELLATCQQVDRYLTGFIYAMAFCAGAFIALALCFSI